MMPSLPTFVHHILMGKIQVILPMTLMLCSLAMQAQITWFVKASPGGDNNGLDWENAFINPQDAFDKARDGDQIYIQSGTYLPIHTIAGQSNPTFKREHTFHITRNIKVYGSFEGNEMSHWDRKFSVPNTIFSGDLNQDDVAIDDLQSEFFPLENNGDNIYHIITVDARVPEVLLDGIHIYGGYASSPISGEGAGIFFQHNATAKIIVDIHRCIFSNNRALNSGGSIFINASVEEFNITYTEFLSNRAGRDGAGLFVRTHRNLKFNMEESKFLNHAAFNGGAIFMESLTNSNIKIAGSDFINNKASESGGAIRFTTTRKTSFFEISRSRFQNNIAGTQGGALYTDQTGLKMDQIESENNSSFDGGFSFSTGLEEYEISLSNCEFKNNRANNLGAGIAAINASLEVKESSFSNHSKPLVGGVFYLYHTVPKTRLYSILADNCIFERNEAVKGAVFFEAAVNQNSGKDNTLFLRSQFRHNKAEEGGVFYISQNIPVNKVFSRTYFSCVFADNNAVNGGMQYYKSTAPADEFFLNCTFYNNKASGKDPLFYFDIPDAGSGKSGVDIFNSILWRNSTVNQNAFIESSQNCQLSLFNTLIDRQSCDDIQYPVQCNNNIYNLDPLFFNAPAGDLRLRVCSPAIDKGDNSPVLFPVFPRTDILKRERIRNNIVDLGAYEVPQPYFAEDTIFICSGDSLWNEALGWIYAPGLYLDTMGILNGCVDEHAYFALEADTINYVIQTFASDCNYDGIEIKVSSPLDVEFEWRKAVEIISSSHAIKIQSPGWYYLSGTGENFCPLMDSIFIDSIPRMPIFTNEVQHINCLQPQGEIELKSNDKDFRISWEGPSGIAGNSALIQSNIPGIYTAVVRDAMDCPYDFRIEILADTISPTVKINEEAFDPCQPDPRELKAELINAENTTSDWLSNTGSWESGSDPLSIFAQASGIYYFRAINIENGCASQDSVEVRMGNGEIVPLLWDETNTGCGDQYTQALKILEMDGGVPPYALSVDGINMDINAYSQIRAGMHEFSIMDWAGCKWDSTFIVEPVPSLFIDLGPDITVKPGTGLELFAATDIPSDHLQFSWNNQSSCQGCPNFPIQILQDTMIIVSASLNQDCIAYDSIQIYIIEDPRIFIPTAFSPNGDGINDVLEFFSGDNVKQVNSFRVYNRWGNLVFDSAHCKDPAGCKWDGKYNSMPLDPQLLVWSMKLEMKNGTTHQLQGEVAIIK